MLLYATRDSDSASGKNNVVHGLSSFFKKVTLLS
jgi:hypothetical protein